MVVRYLFGVREGTLALKATKVGMEVISSLMKVLSKVRPVVGLLVRLVTGKMPYKRLWVLQGQTVSGVTAVLLPESYLAWEVEAAR